MPLSSDIIQFIKYTSLLTFCLIFCVTSWRNWLLYNFPSAWIWMKFCSMYLWKQCPVFNHDLHIDTIKEKFQFYKPLSESSDYQCLWKRGVKEALCQETRNILLHKCLFPKCLTTVTPYIIMPCSFLHKSSFAWMISYHNEYRCWYKKCIYTHIGQQILFLGLWL